MTQYINKSILIEEIKKRISLFKKEKKTEKWSAGASQMNVVSLGARIAMLEEILSFLDTLEVKEEIFDESEKKKLMQKCVHEAYKRGYGMGAFQTTNKMNHNTKEVDLEKEIEKGIETRWYGEYLFTEKFKESAKHFYELGLRTKGD